MDAGSSKSTRQRPRKSRQLNLAAIESLMIAVTDLGDTVRETLGRSMTAEEAKPWRFIVTLAESPAVVREFGALPDGQKDYWVELVATFANAIAWSGPVRNPFASVSAGMGKKLSVISD
jgi:hypothetical protein